MKLQLHRVLGLFVALSSLLLPMKAYSWDWPCSNWSCYNDDCCEYTGPLCEGRWSVLVRGGVVPTHWSESGTTFFSGPSGLVTLGGKDKFVDRFDTPWTVGGELAYNISDSAQIYIEGNYLSADGKKRHSDEILFGIPHEFDHHYKD